MNLNGIEIVKKNEPAENSASPTKIKVVGCGGCGGNAVNIMIGSGVGGVQFIAMNTDLQALAQNKAEVKIQIGQKLAGGLGAGGKPEVGEEAAKEQQEQIKEILKGSDMVFVTAGMGGGTGTGSAPVVARIARELGALTVAVVTTPFKFEGKIRMAHAEEGIRKLRAEVDSLIAIPNELILKDAEKTLSVEGAFVIINDILRQGVQGISDIITKPGLVNRDFKDVQSVMKGQGDAILGIGEGKGDNRAVDAANNAINNRLLVGKNIDGAKNVLINISGNHDVGISECDEIAKIITNRANPDAVILWGQVLDETMEDKISVTVIATGFDSAREEEIPQSIINSEQKINSDTITDDQFIAIQKPKAQEPKPEEPKNDFMKKIGFDSPLYEDKGFHTPSSQQTASAPRSLFDSVPADDGSRSLSDEGSLFNSRNIASSSMNQTSSMGQGQPMNQSSSFGGELNDYAKPACWRKNLEGLSRTINLGKK